MRRNRLMWFLVLILAAACSPGNFLSPAQPTIAPQALTLAAAASTPAASFTATLTAEPASTLTQTATITPTLTTEPSLTPGIEPTLISKDSPYPNDCAYNWAAQDRPELSQMLGAALEDKGFKDVDAHASDHGENCISRKTNVAQFFSAMTTEVEITVHVPIEEHALNTHAASALTVLQNVWTDPTITNAPNGRITLNIVSESGQIRIQGDYNVLMGLLAQHPDAKSLLVSCRSSVSEDDVALLTCER